MKNNMRIGIIGGGASGVFAAIRIKQANPSFDVTIIESNDKLVKKIYATGNGRCNYANTSSLVDKYSNESFCLPIINEFDCEKLIGCFDEIGIHPYYIDELVYPISLSAQTVGLMLEKKVKELNINVLLQTKVSDYSLNPLTIKTNNGDYYFDKIIFATGGSSSPIFGSDGTLYSIFKKHGYNIEQIKPSLCPIKTKENVKKISGQRYQCLVRLFDNNALIHEENGELLFKDDGLSGIVIFNMVYHINKNKCKNPILKIDLLPNINKQISKINFLEYFHPKLTEYLLDHNIDPHNLTFTYKSSYDFNNSHVSSGGISIKDLNNDLSSKLENSVYFIGEVIDVDGACGGYNLMWAFASAEKVKNSL